MKNLNTHSLVAALSVIMMVTACGKNMSMQVSPDTARAEWLKRHPKPVAQAVRTRLPSADAITGQLEGLSGFDLSNKDNIFSPTALTRRSILHVEPKEAVSKVDSMEVHLDQAKIADLTKVSICSATECRDLAPFLGKDPTNLIQFDLRDVFALKTDADAMDWIYNNSTAFAEPGYRKLILSFEGVTDVGPCSDVSYGSEIIAAKMPKDFNNSPTSFENGVTDLYTAGVAGPNEKPIPGIVATSGKTGTSSSTSTATGSTTDTGTGTSTSTDTGTASGTGTTTGAGTSSSTGTTTTTTTGTSTDTSSATDSAPTMPTDPTTPTPPTV